MYGMAVEWEEQPFEWVRPARFGVARTYSKGPITEMRALVELTPRAAGGRGIHHFADIQFSERSRGCVDAVRRIAMVDRAGRAGW